MFQEVMIHQSFEPNCVSKSFTFSMISKLKLFKLGQTIQLWYFLWRLQDQLFKKLNLDFIWVMNFSNFHNQNTQFGFYLSYEFSNFHNQNNHMVSSTIWLLLTLQWASMHNHKSASYVSIIAGVLKLFVASEFFLWSLLSFELNHPHCWEQNPSN